MSLWKVSTDNCAAQERGHILQQAMERIYLPPCKFSGTLPGTVDLSSLDSPQGIEFSILSGSPMEISGRSGEQPFHLWLCYLIEGEFTLKRGKEEMPAPKGSIIYAPTDLDMTLSIHSDFRLLYIKIPKTLINNRLLSANLINAGSLHCTSGINRVFASMLAALSENLEEFEDALLSPIEAALSEFILSNLVRESRILGFGSNAKLIHFNQICQLIDANLSNPELSLNMVSEHFKVSSRYVQKLFEQTDESFISYVRCRRLERCCFELSHVEYAHLSVSDICFRWGFNDAGHFSRTFRKSYGMTPREYRKKYTFSQGRPSPVKAEALQMLAS